MKNWQRVVIEHSTVNLEDNFNPITTSLPDDAEEEMVSTYEMFFETEDEANSFLCKALDFD